MRILVEEYQYRLCGDEERQHDLQCILKELGGLEDLEGRVSINHVGYYYSTALKDCVFILPKVLITVGDDRRELVFGQYRPEDIINVSHDSTLTDEQRRFIYEFAVWIYRAIDVYRNSRETGIIFYKHIPQVGKGRRRMTNTYLDVLLSLIQFNRDNQNFFFFTLRNQHSGLNKINWTKTIARSKAFVQGEGSGQEVVYLDVVNRKRRINFDEELLVIFFSILNYINDKYGFAAEINVNFPLIPRQQFENWLRGMGKVRLHQIKYKYFSDKALELWELCYAFFDRAHQINSATDMQEYLLAKDFNIVFEGIIDHLLGDELPKKYRPMKEQPDGKMVDHMYSWYNLTTRDKDEQQKIFYIGDSKYYKRTNAISKESWYKQFTYARNLIQWNLDLFLDGRNDDGDVLLRDDVTEGDNIIPNFFISATMDEGLSYKTDIYPTEREKKFQFSRQFENRLFDRDSLLVCHYDVNFLYIISLYARRNKGQQAAWRTKVRDMFRREIQQMLQEHYDFRVMTPRHGVNASAYIEEHFQQLLGKVFTPYENEGPRRYYSLALSNRPEFEEENAAIVSQLETAFHVRDCKIGDNPREILADVKEEPVVAIPAMTDFLTLHYLEKYQEKMVLVGCYKDEAHLRWIMGENDKGSLIYNVRLGKNVPGGQILSQLEDKTKTVSFVILYEYGHEAENRYHVLHVHHHATMDAERFLQTKTKNGEYPLEASAGKYFCYVCDEEVSLGSLDIATLISKHRIDKRGAFQEGAPIYLTGSELMKYRKSFIQNK